MADISPILGVPRSRVWRACTLRILAGLLSLGLLLAGCGGGESGASPSLTQAAAAATTNVGLTTLPPLATTAPAVPSGSTTADPGTAQPPQSPSNIAVWGDSLANGFSYHLQFIYSDRLVFNGGISMDTSSMTAERVGADTDHRNWIVVLWTGNVNRGENEQIKADLARMIQSIAPNQRYVILSPLNLINEIVGTPGHALNVRLNQELAAQYPNNFLDARQLLIDAHDSTLPQDVIDAANGISPSSLRWDYIHLRDEGYVLVGRRLKQLLAEKGWF
jgi:lysophospholipase L1-like esterase